jgi:predicted negative regulator of RcsB-dependent stress response
MIANILEKIKTWFRENEKDIILAIGVFLIAVISFGLGILFQKEQVPIVIEAPEYCATSSVASGQSNF